MTPELFYEGRNVRTWRLGQNLTVRESALFPRVYTCLTCLVTDCVHAKAVADADAIAPDGAAPL